MTPRTWCFPVAGCVSYRGYFNEGDARKFAAQLSLKGDDVYVGGVAAYSTLGRFSDPIINTMIGYADYQLAGLIFHELAHQRLYVQGDSKFNEGFAEFVEHAGLQRWFRADRTRVGQCQHRLSVRRSAQLRQLLSTARERLDSLYASDLPEAETRGAKARVFADLSHEYAQLRATWPTPPYFDQWISGNMNNARLAALATYADYVPAFGQLFIESGQDFDEFYARAQTLGQLSDTARGAAIVRLRSSAQQRSTDAEVACASVI